jgi:hypothetical protein
MGTETAGIGRDITKTAIAFFKIGEGAVGAAAI